MQLPLEPFFAKLRHFTMISKYRKQLSLYNLKGNSSKEILQDCQVVLSHLKISFLNGHRKSTLECPLAIFVLFFNILMRKRNKNKYIYQSLRMIIVMFNKAFVGCHHSDTTTPSPVLGYFLKHIQNVWSLFSLHIRHCTGYLPCSTTLI